MAASARHKGWLFKHNEGILAAVNIGAKGGASVLATNTALNGVLLGTPVTPALAVDSIVISNLVASGDILLAANNGGNSQAWLWVDSSAGTMRLYGAGTAVVELASTYAQVLDDILLGLGTGNTARLSYDTTDANANALLLQMPAGGAVDVPVLAVGQSIESVDLGLFNGLVNPTVALFGIGAVATSTDLRFYKARGTIAAPTVVTTGDDLGTIRAYGAVAAGEYVQAAEIRFDMAGTIATTRGPGTITFLTATDEAPSVLTQALLISAAQLVTAASLTSTGAFTASSTSALNGNVTVADDILLGIGTGNTTRFSWDTTDANANELLLQMPAGGAVDVPVLAIGQSIESVDLGLFNGVVDPTIGMFGIGAVATGVSFRAYKARGTIAAPTVVTTGDDLFSLNVYGAVAAGEYVQAARILFEMTGTIATTRGPGVITFQTATDDAPSVLTTALTLTAAQDAVITNGGVLVGSATQVTVSDGDGATNLIPEVQAMGIGTAFAGGAILAATFNATNTRVVSPKIILVKGAAATQVATTAVADNEVVGSIIAFASDSADFETPVGAIEFVVDDSGGPGAGNIGGSIEFYTTADGGEVLTLALTISAAQLSTFAAGIQANTRIDVGITGTTTGIVAIDGATSGTVSMTVAATAGTWTFTLPATAGEAGDALFSDGTGISSWVAGMRSVDVQLTNAQLLALLGTDITLVAAPGANRAIVVHAIYLFFDVTTTAYTINAGATSIGYASDGVDVAVVTEAGFLDTVADSGRWYMMGGAAATPAIITPVTNAAIVIRKATADMTGGNAANTLSVRVYYSVVDFVAFT